MAEDNMPKVLSDPGWNDPPIFSYDSVKNHTKKSSLSRRVSNSSIVSNDTQKLCANVDNNGKTAPPRSGPINSSISAGSTHLPDTQNISPQSIELNTVLENLQLTIKELYPNDNEKDVNEIKRRLGLMEKLWNEDKFSTDVKLKLGDISKGLLENDFVTCDNLQRSLMVDYTALCSSWMAAIRSLINSKRKTQEKNKES
ncbi:steroid receptor RNA activator 1 [Halyomorpha halys]|uniref:steroid receptor RNA activator 1 n=1 Tax=Halyomorpha halys TaxID=286706 RepID=UPI0006D4D075|nr:steroid receptor RNA activator 1-like [Halyomorpha halys]